MGRELIYQYYVEGEDEKCLLRALRSDLQCIRPGKIEIFNALQDRFDSKKYKSRLRTLHRRTTVVLVFDTDTMNVNILRENIQFLKKQGMVREVLCIPQVKNLEEELVYCCRIRRIEDFMPSRSRKNFKSDLIACTNLAAKLTKNGFSVEKLWSRRPEGIFAEFPGDGEKIKLTDKRKGPGK